MIYYLCVPLSIINLSYKITQRLSDEACDLSSPQYLFLILVVYDSVGYMNSG